MTDGETSHTGGRDHWDEAYGRKGEAGVSWFEETPSVSLELIAAIPEPKRALIDVGGGASRLAAHALRLGFDHVAVLDLSAEAIARSRAAMGSDAARVDWIVSDVTAWRPDRRYDVWHDRAAFHFITEPSARAVYVDRLDAALAPQGHAVIATFALDGPDRCSGLPVRRYAPETLVEALGPKFRLVASRRHVHTTPWGAAQPFQFSVVARAG